MANIVPARLRKAYDSARYQSWPVVLWRIGAKLVSPVVKLGYQVLYEFDLARPIEQRRARIDCTIELATEADVDGLMVQRGADLVPDDGHRLSDEAEYLQALHERSCLSMREDFLRWMRAGEMCFVARVDNEIAHSNWIRFHDCLYAGPRPIELRPGEIYTTEGFTTDRWRGQGLHEAVNSHMLRYAQSRGARHAYTIADLTNLSRRGVVRVGWTVRGHHVLIKPRLLRRQWDLALGGDIDPIMRDLSELPTDT